ncbi:CBS domain-containing protein [Desulfopila aestuarii]|uniref:tRNA nucleotidyltransferase (CCA-adding enzyme) n=1 Tax=Desulfopila aestuarii DSM 18488 TaxID=1121416 RepID=A0A1M7Y7T8_9BACT|nr:CBS domain-containing protein [Desulfopila aestuarii]SHO48641.1 tRNA nucleotidyltransferase (CCA-adding enzyme) [Desulfopila aestuarii DSM 18488]
MQVITTHLNADFDGMASMVAAHKLYPDAILSFSGSQEKNLRDFISQTLLYRYDFQKPRTIDPAQVDTLIIVDTRASDRLGNFAQCLKNTDITVHIYDHHPENPGDIKGDVEVVRNVGATATIFTQLLRERDITITPEEATIICLGIYEDTGSLTHLTTTPDDLEAAAWLLRMGAKLDIVSQFITYELTTMQVELLHDLMKTATQYTIQSIPIVVVTHSLPHYVDDFALIVRRFMVMENLDTLFALVSMAGRIYLIARSRIPDINVGAIARDLGGGGHATAASATVRDMTLIEAHEKLIQSLHRHVRPQPIARELMSAPAITIPADITLASAQILLNRYSINSVPVEAATISRKPDCPHLNLVGIITRQVIEKAVHHDLGHLPVSDYMSTDIDFLSLNATLSDIQELIIENHQRLIPIIHENTLQGVITRTDLLNHLVNDPSHLPRNLLHETEYPSLERKRNLNSLMIDCLTKPMIQLLQKIGEVADEVPVNAFAVGGFVRDLLLKKRNLDLDIVVEGNGIEFAKHLAGRLGGRYRTHERFSTAMVLMPDGFKIDIATARLEYYEYPAALPTVELSSIKLDLYRRDFTINAMAVQLNPQQFGTLIDFFNCQNDLKQKEIKVLHNLSFVEDPSRIFRAIRFEKRMSFTMAPHTARLIRNAVKMQLFGKAADTRFFSEIRLIFSEENPIPAIQRMADFNLFQFLWPDLKPHLKVDRRFLHILLQAQRAIDWYRLLYLKEECDNWIVYLLAIMGRSKAEVLEAFCKRFLVPQKITDNLVWQKMHADKVANLLARRNALRNSEIYWLLQDLDIEGLLYVMAIARKSTVKKAVSNYVTEMRQAATLISGRDLMALGYEPGPAFKIMLNDLLDARLDGIVTSKSEEITFIQENYPLNNLPENGRNA